MHHVRIPSRVFSRRSWLMHLTRWVSLCFALLLVVGWIFSLAGMFTFVYCNRGNQWYFGISPNQFAASRVNWADLQEMADQKRFQWSSGLYDQWLDIEYLQPIIQLTMRPSGDNITKSGGVWMPFWIPTPPALLLAAIVWYPTIVRLVRGWRLRTLQVCKHCGYSIEGLSANAPCPECGTTISS
jgi:hypothetical protein